MHSAPISSIIITQRQRKELGPTELQKLKVSILSKGLMHAPVMELQDDDQLRLIAGERRLRAIMQLHEEGHEIKFDGAVIPTDHIPYVRLTDLPEDDRMEAELEENLLRKDLTWMERCQAIDALHQLRQSQRPEQTQDDTAKEIAEVTGKSLSHEKKAVTRAAIISANAHRPEVQRAKTEEQAYKRILDEDETKFKSLIQRSKISVASPHKLLQGDCREILPTLEAGCCNTIIADPPYGINAHQSGQESNHYYEDTPAYGREISEFIISEGFRLLPERGILFMFCDVEHYIHLRDFAKRQAYSVHRTPLIWHKGTGGRAGWGRAGFKRAYEILLFAVKGQDELVTPGGDDVMTFKQSDRSERDHAANKPKALLSHLIQLSTLKGETVLDPTCGSGTIIPAAEECGVNSICIEMDPNSFAKAAARASGEGGDFEEDDPSGQEEEE